MTELTGGSERFYDDLGEEYNAAILRCVPRYHEMLDAILRYLPCGLEVRRVLELGCGGGHLTRKVLQAYPRCQIHAVDLSAEMLSLCKQTSNSPRLNLVRNDFHDLCFAEGAFDLVVSSISIHHIDDSAKRKLFRRVHECLRAGGVFCYSDQFAGETTETYHKHIETWKVEATALGASAGEWDSWMRHQDNDDYHASLRDQINWLSEAGFATIDCVWRYLLWTVVLAERKPS